MTPLPLLLLAALLGATRPADEAPAPPRLVVLVTVDQCRADYTGRFAEALGEGGFLRLREQGAWFERAAFTHTLTSTAPGHAVIATGCRAARNGIVGNEWIDHGSGMAVGCVADPFARRVGAPGAGISASRLERPTLGDRLRRHYGPEARVLSFGGKDRSALLLGGMRSDGSFFVDRASGAWVTSDRLLAARPVWLEVFERSRPLDRLRGRSWTPSVPAALLRRLAGQDDVPGEGWPGVLGTTFPHGLSGASLRGGLATLVSYTPFADERVLETASLALEAEDLGADELPDLLCVSFASLDYVGHVFGPDSWEVLDTFVRLDRLLENLMERLDEAVGPGQWTLALTGDHGVAPLPERSGGRRVSFAAWTERLEADLRGAFGDPPAGAPSYLAGIRRSGVTLRPELRAAPDGNAAAVARRLARTLQGLPGVLAAVPREELDATAEGPLGDLARDLHRDRSGDVLFLLERHTVEGATGTSHGTHHDYDRQVPLALLGKGVRQGRIGEPADPMDLAPTLARLLQLGPWEGLDGRVLESALSRP